MAARGWRVGMLLLLGALTARCGSPTGATADELSAIISRDGLAFSGPALPAEVIERVAGHRVVVLGETHHLREHYELTTELLRVLHERGFRQLLVEQPQMADWWLNDYATRGPLDPPWDVPANWERKFAALRLFNAGLPPAERIQVRAIDVNESYYGGASSFRNLLAALVAYLPTPGPVAAFVQVPYGTPSEQTRAVADLAEALEGDRVGLRTSWGATWYDAVAEMVAVERESIGIRVDREGNDDRAARTREAMIKELADARIAGTPSGTVINIGGNHAQKSHLKGTRQEWLGDYLVHRSPVTGGSVFVISFVSARTVLEPGASGTPFDVLDSSPPNELFRLMAEAWPDRNAVLVLDDPLFSAGQVRVAYEETIYVCALQAHYDAVLQYGLAHRVPID